MRIIFMGSPEVVINPCKSLAELCRQSSHELAAVISQPAKPAGRRRTLTDPPLAAWAKEQGLEVLQPEKASSPDFLSILKDLNPDIIITAAYGQILSQSFLDIPKRGTINIHPSMLPKYRGASPIQTALFDGCATTGVSILFTVKKLDAGNIILQEESPIAPLETAEDLMDRMFKLGGERLKDAIELLEDPNYHGTPQAEDEVTHCHKFEKTSGVVDWDIPAQILIHRYQAFKPWSGTFAYYNGKRILFEEIAPIADETIPPLAPREFKYIKAIKSLVVKAKDGYIALKHLKPEGSKVQDGAAFWNGLKLHDRGQFDES